MEENSTANKASLPRNTTKVTSLKIIQVAHSFPPYIGGLSHVIENLATNLAKIGHEVEVVTLDTHGKLPPIETYRSIRVRRFRGIAPQEAYYTPTPRVIKYLHQAEADIIHVHNIGALLAPAAWLALKTRNKKPKYIITPHHHESGSKWHTRLLWKPYKPLARKIIRDADKVHSVSHYEAELIKRDFKTNPIIIPNGVSEDVFQYKWNPPGDEAILTYAGRIEAYKRLDLLIKTARKLQENNPTLKIRVRLIGEGPHLQETLTLAREQGVQVEHHPFQERKKYLALLSSSTALVNLSENEAYSIVTAEALAIGVPAIIAEPWGNTFRQTPHVHIVDRENIQQITRVIEEIIRNPGKENSTPSIKPWSQVAREIHEKIYTT